MKSRDFRLLANTKSRDGSRGPVPHCLIRWSRMPPSLSIPFTDDVICQLLIEGSYLCFYSSGNLQQDGVMERIKDAETC